VTVLLIKPTSAQHWGEARRLIEEYAASLHIDLAFQNLAHELVHLASEYAAPGGAFFIAVERCAYLGCVGLRHFAATDGEIKRMYVTPAARGRGIGRLLATAVTEAGRELGYSRLLLDTLASMTAAVSLYQSLGFRPTTAYRFNPETNAVFLELQLK
jgi:GNAT superfamily N-acetyltransferase